MTVPIDITNPRLVKAYAHPLRIRILSLLEDRIASPNELASELDARLGTTSYHVRQLARLGLVELVHRETRRGAVVHFYTATVRPTITDEGWAQIPEIVKRAHLGGILQTAVAHIVAAAEQGGLDRPDAHFSRTTARLDAQGWKEMAQLFAGFLEQVDRIGRQSEARVQDDPTLTWEEATAIMTLFSRASPKALPARRSVSPRKAPDRF